MPRKPSTFRYWPDEIDWTIWYEGTEVAAGGSGDSATFCPDGATTAPTPMRDSCPESCYSQTCDYWVGYGYDCNTLETYYGCDCFDCDCPTEAPIPAPTASPTLTPVPTIECDATCFGYPCDFWTEYGYTCATLEDTYGCGCSGCECGTNAPYADPTPAPTPITWAPTQDCYVLYM